MVRRSSVARVFAGVLAGTALCLSSVFAFQETKEWKSGVNWSEPVMVDPGPPGGPPSDAIVLFDGDDLDQWNGAEDWTFEDGYCIVGSEITTRQGFGDCQLHLEFATPAEIEGEGQGRGNSGVYLMDRYEVQILDSWENTTYYDGQCGAIYKQRPPMVNASRQPGEWQTYDILFTAPRFYSDGRLKSPAYLTLLHNGVVVHNHYELQGLTDFITPPKYEAHSLREPIKIQFHNDAVRFRNIWIRDLLPSDASAAAPDMIGD